MKLPLCVALSLALCACATTTPNADYGNYSGKGGMLAYDIDGGAYQYHYDHGFTGQDAVGWDENLQYAWSRIAGAKTCGMTVNDAELLSLLKNKFGHDELVHEINGVGFHHLQQRKIQNFCTPKRVQELKDVMPKIQAGNFPKKF